MFTSRNNVYVCKCCCCSLIFLLLVSIPALPFIKCGFAYAVLNAKCFYTNTGFCKLFQQFAYILLVAPFAFAIYYIFFHDRKTIQASLLNQYVLGRGLTPILILCCLKNGSMSMYNFLPPHLGCCFLMASISCRISPLLKC